MTQLLCNSLTFQVFAVTGQAVSLFSCLLLTDLTQILLNYHTAITNTLDI